jgi:hypothetical protein
MATASRSSARSGSKAERSPAARTISTAPTLARTAGSTGARGAFAEQTHERPGKPPIKDRAAHIFRCKPDGSELEVVMSGGMDNPGRGRLYADRRADFHGELSSIYPALGNAMGWRTQFSAACFRR